MTITARDRRIMNFLRRHAIDVKPVGNARIAAAVGIRNDVISIGYCQRRTHPFQAKFSKNKEAIYLHAETSAISNSLNHVNKRDLINATLYIHRVKYPNDLNKDYFVDGLAKPCEGCMRAIMAFGLKKVVYSTDAQQDYEIIFPNDKSPINMVCS